MPIPEMGLSTAQTTPMGIDPFLIHHTSMQRPAIRYVDGYRMRRALIAGAQQLIHARQHLDDINVFPMPDGDTGTNMASTMRSVADHARAVLTRPVGPFVASAADAASMGARGCSGAILAQFFRGLAEGLAHVSRATTDDFVPAVAHAAAWAESAVTKPQDGTMLTVIRSWAAAVGESSARTKDFGEVLGASLDRARAALARTTEQLGALRAAGVVDAGALGFVYVLEGITHLIEAGRLEHAETHHTAADDARPVRNTRMDVNERTVALVTDTGCDLPDELIARYDIHTVPLRIHFGSRQYVDRVTLSPAAFYEMLAREDDHPKTSQPAPHDFERTYEDLLAHCGAVVSIHVPGAVSGTYQSARRVAQRVSDRICVIDSTTVSVGLGLVVLEAARAIEAGCSLPEVQGRIRTAIDRLQVYFSLETMDAIVRGGRVSRLKGLIARFVRMKPILTFDDAGNVQLLDRALAGGSARKRVLHRVLQHAGGKRDLRFAVAHAEAPEVAAWYARRLQDAFPDAEIIVCEISPALGVHAGPGASGIAFLGED